MSNILYRRVLKLTEISLATVFLMAITIIFSHEAYALNNTPVISSEPTLVVTTDQVYNYSIKAVDIDNDKLSYSLSTFPEGMTITNDVITWSPITAGMFNVVIEVKDTNNGFDSQAWQINVKPGDVRSIIVTPNDQPTIMTTDQKHQFIAQAYDNYGNLIDGAIFSWTSDGEFITVDTNGMVTAVKPGIGYVKANIGDIQSAPGIVVKTATPTDEVVNTNTQLPETDDEAEDVTEDVNDDVEILTSTENKDEDENTKDVEEVCEENINHSLTFVLLIIYGIILIIYFGYEKKHKSSSWWIFPLLISFIGLIVYYRYFCPQTYLWWPWVMVIMGVIITGYYKGRTKSEDNISNNELPF